MSYRSLKRVLGGETHLERKCRLLFGSCLFILISLTFLSVDQIAERLIREVPRRIGADHAKLSLYRIHWKMWQTADEPAVEELSKELQRDLQAENFRTKVLGLKPDEIVWTALKDGEAPVDEAERRLLIRLQERVNSRNNATDETAKDSKKAPVDAKDEGAPRGSLFQTQNEIFDERSLSSEYWFYTPVVWTKTCYLCHAATPNDATALAGFSPDSNTSQPPFRALKIIIPTQISKNAVMWTRGLLISIAVATVGLSMLGLWAIVQYVIVKPLNHLRNVSDEITSGNTSMRADIRTGDEFEELATAFNKMLRHLTDAQAELRDVNADLDARLDQLAQLNMRLYEMNRLKDDFLANMSHELRTPLNSIIGFSEVLQGIDSLNEKQKRYAQNIQKSGRVLLDMINEVLDLAKLEAGKMDVRPSEFRLDVVVQAQCDMVRALTEEKNIDLTVEIPSDLPPMYQDQSKVQQILTNLLSNAIKFTPEGGIIKVSARRMPAGRMELLVADTGVGIAQEDREIIFEKFRQSRAVLGTDGLTRAYSGTGLGLSIVKELCKLLHGEISVESELGKGSTFRIELPWQLSGGPTLESRLNAKLDELNRPRRELTTAALSSTGDES